MDKPLRLIGGSYAGQIFMIDERQPVFKLPVKTELGAILGRPDDPIMPTTVKLELYHVMSTGGDHLYGICEPLVLPEALDMMWQEYKRGQS